ncbi:S41 family peptidase [Gloeocapsopsis dulcis]|uniref:S41 family peptidase n=1 Tax=Gloeocapsopsis dulcis TaxID=2859516 RepID=UPI0018C66F96|nr:S41 family peptidase [Gloeocapsopsis dulcis]WNN88876.1 S41 family peptidase [Gloeocapsopsis dulcis]
MTSTEETDVSLNWFTDSQLKPTDTVSASEAKAFVRNVYQMIDDKIFDPAFKKAERKQQQQDLLATINTQPSWSRAELTERISNELNKLSVSHLRILDPVEGETLFRIFEQKPLPDITPTPSVSAEMRGEVGILRVESFIVPLITKAELDRAKAQLAQAQVILIDVRGNGGGFGSSISYLVEDIIGPDKVLSRDRTREGLQAREPYVFRGYFDDAINAEAKAEIELSQTYSYIEWRTRLEAQVDPRPHFILVDEQCGSACDLFAGIIKDYGSAKILGVRTMGALLGGDAFRLRWQGFALIAPTVQVILPKGHMIEGVGVQPDIEIPECANGGNQCLEKAIAIADAAI